MKTAKSMVMKPQFKMKVVKDKTRYNRNEAKKDIQKEIKDT